jgi:hypothetical protein
MRNKREREIPGHDKLGRMFSTGSNYLHEGDWANDITKAAERKRVMEMSRRAGFGLGRFLGYVCSKVIKIKGKLK